MANTMSPIYFIQFGSGEQKRIFKLTLAFVKNNISFNLIVCRGIRRHLSGILRNCVSQRWMWKWFCLSIAECFYFSFFSVKIISYLLQCLQVSSRSLSNWMKCRKSVIRFENWWIFTMISKGNSTVESDHFGKNFSVRYIAGYFMLRATYLASASHFCSFWV